MIWTIVISIIMVAALMAGAYTLGKFATMVGARNMVNKMLDAFQEVHEKHAKTNMTKSQEVTHAAFVTECLLKVWTIPVSNSIPPENKQVLEEQLEHLESLKAMLAFMKGE